MTNEEEQRRLTIAYHAEAGRSFARSLTPEEADTLLDVLTKQKMFKEWKRNGGDLGLILKLAVAGLVGARGTDE